MKAYVYIEWHTIVAISTMTPLIQEPQNTMRHEIDRYEAGMDIVYEDIMVKNYYASRGYNNGLEVLKIENNRLKSELEFYKNRCKESNDYDHIVKQSVLAQRKALW